MNNDLIERYIYAVTKRMPENTKNDVSDELRGLIDDMLCERCGDVIPGDKDVRIVLTELGTPQELYEKYNNSTKKCLIGSPYYSTYKYVLKIVLICVSAGIVISVAASGMFDIFKTAYAGEFSEGISYAQPWINLFINMFTMLPSGMLWAFAFVTLLFAFFYHNDIKIDTSGNLDNLPPVPKKSQKISKLDPIVGIAFSVVFLVVFLVAPQIFCAIIRENNQFIPIFNVETVRSTWYIIVLFSLIGITREVVELLEGQYNKRVMVTTVVADVATAILTIWWLLNDNLINPEFTKYITTLFKEEVVINIFTNFQCFFLVCILFALTLDTVTTVVKTMKK